ncbi:TetR/AcrR family transcriptional regulator [Nitrospirillum sp. BR 11163]|uniref:TetR/AcrR family transcriptional regulator n=1 Tax=Nitrospirillum sp. BR 11163 TaxID=3104323 RepID=UPI002B003CAE|nr:TetR/AcrR family transcriptional regulator [Nitrospirillum sp. BR 11163]MEA1672715.1 TetR/AcrR family transcriptional regulator [Nitrospirillum sp. BR 11163]
MTKRPRRAPSGPRLGREDWVLAAKKTLVARGIEAVKVDRLAKGFGVTRGSFYWHFKSRGELLQALLTYWQDTNTTALRAAVASSTDGIAQFRAVIRVWVDEKDFSPSFDTAVRDWARQAKAVAALLRKVDEERIQLLSGIFRNLGHDEAESAVRARVLYYHQVGYYALAIKESRADRLATLPYYYKILTGLTPPANGIL